ncbi:hypothetical protein MTR67_034281 [Solanum verrucosum]|uniref:Tf2-1-like SH3-like domain-containing protein n=1 Tax=Solanum verrucosum TaxID=315347 RepID=A0AAF0U809_SOLVR|nr:hypothetical protein MTR67_034281 [Solanum verrucosum]
MKRVMRFGKKGKLNPRYVGPYKILKRVGSKVDKFFFTSIKVLWRSQSVEGATWEAEAAMKAKYPHLFTSNSIPA